MLMTLPDGTSFRMVPPEQIPLTLMIRVQRLTDIGPIKLQARLAANKVRMAELAPLLVEMNAAAQASEQDPQVIGRLVRELALRTEDGDLDLEVEGIHVWISRILAGEKELTLDEACNFNLWEAVRELEPEEQAEQDRLAREAEAKSPTSAAASRNGRASGSKQRALPTTSTSTVT